MLSQTSAVLAALAGEVEKKGDDDSPRGESAKERLSKSSKKRTRPMMYHVITSRNHQYIFKQVSQYMVRTEI